MTIDQFDAAKEAAFIREYKAKITTQKRNNRSTLDKHKIQLLQLHSEGLSIADLHRWLRLRKRVKVEYSTVHRWLKKHSG